MWSTPVVIFSLFLICLACGLLGVVFAFTEDYVQALIGCSIGWHRWGSPINIDKSTPKEMSFRDRTLQVRRCKNCGKVEARAKDSLASSSYDSIYQWRGKEGWRKELESEQDYRYLAERFEHDWSQLEEVAKADASYDEQAAEKLAIRCAMDLEAIRGGYGYTERRVLEEENEKIQSMFELIEDLVDQHIGFSLGTDATEPISGDLVADFSSKLSALSDEYTIEEQRLLAQFDERFEVVFEVAKELEHLGICAWKSEEARKNADAAGQYFFDLPVKQPQ